MEDQSDVFKKLAVQLSHVDKQVRDRGVSHVRKFLQQNKSKALDQLEMMKVWKGLYYCYWMSDKPLVQEALASELAVLMDDLAEKTMWNYYECFWKTMIREWAGIDRLRIDKFYNLVRCFLIQGLHHVKNAGKKSDGVNIFVNILTNLPLNEENSLSILLHLVDYYMADVIATGFSRTAAETLMAPMIDLLGSAKNPVIVQRLYVSVVEKLLDDNALGLDLGKIGEKCFDMGSDPSCLAKNRKILYQISKLFAEKKQEKKRDPPQKKQKIRIQSQNLEPMAPVVQVQEGEEKSKKKGLKRQKSVSFDFEKNQVREFDRMKSPSVFNDVKKSKKKSRRESL